MSRFKELRNILNERRYFKIVCGAGNEDCDEVYKLSLVYTLAGAAGIDISANVEVVKNCARGIDAALKLVPVLKKAAREKPFINVSIGMKGDPHIRKAKIDEERCVKCGACIKECLQKAITGEYAVMEKRCIGCGSCAKVCPADAIAFFDKRKELKKILPDCLRHGAETFELHAIIPDDAAVMEDWRLMNDILPDNFISMCLDRSQLSDSHVIKRIKAAQAITGERLMIQADGVPMSGGEDDYNTTLQAIAIADIIQKNKIPAMIIASGGTNTKTGELARKCGVGLNGVAVGTFARKVISHCIADKRFNEDMGLIAEAVRIAEKLVVSNINEISHGQFKD